MIARIIPLIAVASLSLCGCACVGALQTWTPGRAASDAERDIAANKIRFAYVGGYASLAPCLPEGSFAVIRRYARLYVGDQSCFQDDGSAVRGEYACRYNERMWRHVSAMPRKSSNQAMQ